MTDQRSATIKVWGRANSSNVAKVMWAIAELDLPVERIDIGGPFGGTSDPSYRALNPMGQIPTIEDRGFVLWESNAIVRYLAANYGVDLLWPTSRHGHADADRWMDWASLTMAPTIDALRKAYKQAGSDGESKTSVEQATVEAAARWRILEPRLERHAFVIGDTLSVADISLGALVHRWHIAPLARPELPAVSAWYDRLKTRPHYVERIASKVT